MSSPQSALSEVLAQPELGPGKNKSRAIFGLALMDHAGKWREAYRIALVNAGIFVSLAVAMFVLEPKSLALILSAPSLFFLGGILSFLLLIRSGGDLATVTWFVFGSSVYFGLGAVAGGLHVHPHSEYLFADDRLYLIRVNLLNACSVFIVLAVAYPLANLRGMRVNQQDMSIVNIERILHRVFPYILLISAIGIGLKYALFPVTDSLLLRSMAAKIYLIIPSCFLLLGLLWRTTSWQLRLIAGSILLLEIINGLIGLTKYQIISAMLALVIGLGMTKRSVVFLIISFMVVASTFALINPVITLGRAHIDYDAYKNTITTRFVILRDTVNAYYLDNDTDENDNQYIDEKEMQEGSSVEPNKLRQNRSEKFKRDVNDDYSKKFTHDVKETTTTEARLRALGRRFDVASIQGYLVNEYLSGRPGYSLSDFWAVMVPRVLWPEKPIMTRFGVELNAQYYYIPGGSVQKTSATAPTYSAEAYWNYGVPGVVLVSILLGLGVGWFTRCWQYALQGHDPAFFLIAFPAAIWVSFVESWLIATYLGEFIIFVVILLSARAFFAMMRTLRNRVYS